MSFGSGAGDSPRRPQGRRAPSSTSPLEIPEPPAFVVLGTAQDGGLPQAGCRCARCEAAWREPARRRDPACAAVVLRDAHGRSIRWLLDATPALPAQLRRLDELAPPPEGPPPGLAGILLTHGHMGHYTGLMHMGREAMGAHGVPVHAMPRMTALLRTQSPWRELVAQGRVALRPLAAGRALPLGPGVTVTPLLVPHRDEHTETVAFRVDGPRRRVLHLPDIDAWPDAGDARLDTLLASCDRAYLDGTFLDAGELPGRDPAEVPHPTIHETLARREASRRDAPGAARAELRFTHLNHGNPAADPDGPARRAIEAAGAGVAREGEWVGL